VRAWGRQGQAEALPSGTPNQALQADRTRARLLGLLSLIHPFAFSFSYGRGSRC